MSRDEPADPYASDSHGATIAASLVSTAPGAVDISDVFRHPDWQGRGAATACVAESRRPIERAT